MSSNNLRKSLAQYLQWRFVVSRCQIRTYGRRGRVEGRNPLSPKDLRRTRPSLGKTKQFIQLSLLSFHRDGVAAITATTAMVSATFWAFYRPNFAGLTKMNRPTSSLDIFVNDQFLLNVHIATMKNNTVQIVNVN